MTVPRLADTPKHADLIYDIGMHTGEDTEFYLRKGFRVVAVEANPELTRQGRERFADFVAGNRLEIVEGAIVDTRPGEAPAATVPFFSNDAASVFGTVNAEWAERNSRLGAPSHVIDVRALDFASVLREHGIPYYMKIDIEGADLLCVEALKLFAERPDYISIESDKTSFRAIRQEIDLFVDLGYDAFQAVDQSSLPRRQTPPFPPHEGTYVPHRFEPGSSGLFGRELSAEWRSRAEILRRYRAIRVGYALFGDDGLLSGISFPGTGKVLERLSRLWGRVTGGDVPGWYDTHARLATVGGKHAQ